MGKTAFACFNPCFNGSMYKNWKERLTFGKTMYVSILVLMDLCIKTACNQYYLVITILFQSLF